MPLSFVVSVNNSFTNEKQGPNNEDTNQSMPVVRHPGRGSGAHLHQHLKDKFGLSWQVVPTVLQKMILDPDTAKSQRAFQAMLQMKKFDIAALQRAFDGK